jgi:transposase-like protein
MTKGNPGNRFSTEVRARAVRMVLENEADYKSRSQAVASIAEKFGCSRATYGPRAKTKRSSSWIASLPCFGLARASFGQDQRTLVCAGQTEASSPRPAGRWFPIRAAYPCVYLILAPQNHVFSAVK